MNSTIVIEYDGKLLLCSNITVLPREGDQLRIMRRGYCEEDKYCPESVFNGVVSRVVHRLEQYNEGVRHYVTIHLERNLDEIWSSDFT